MRVKIYSSKNLFRLRKLYCFCENKSVPFRGLFVLQLNSVFIDIAVIVALKVQVDEVVNISLKTSAKPCQEEKFVVTNVCMLNTHKIMRRM